MPDTWVTPRVWTAGERVGQSKMNEISQDLRVLFPYTTPGDLAFRSASGNYLDRLAASGNALKFLRANAAGDGYEFVGGGISADYHSNLTSYSYSSSTWRDVPNSSKSVTVAVTSTIVVIGIVEHHATDSPNYYGFADFKFNVDGTDIDWALTSKTYGATLLPIPIIGMKTGVTAGSKTIKIRERCTAGSYESYYKHYVVLVIPE
jgi:hypothetical protein